MLTARPRLLRWPRLLRLCVLLAGALCGGDVRVSSPWRSLRASLLDRLPDRLLLPSERLKLLALDLLAEREGALEAGDLELVVELLLGDAADAVHGRGVGPHHGLVLGGALGDGLELCIAVLTHLVCHRLQLRLDARPQALLPLCVWLDLGIQPRRESGILLRDGCEQRRHRL